jgi:hypothetical protein
MRNISAAEPPVHSPTLAERHRDELRASGLTDETIDRSGIYSAPGPEIATLLGWNGNFMGAGFVIPFGEGYSRVKLDNPRHTCDAKVIKYESPRKKANRAYFALDFDRTCKAGGPIVVTEGEKKALAIAQLGFAVIGLVGVWGWQQKRCKTDAGRAFGKRELIGDLDRMEWAGVSVIIIFDSDAAENPMVRLAECRLAEVLQSKGAVVRIARIPPNGEKKVGADDFLVGNGADAFRSLLEAAAGSERPPALSTLDWARSFVSEFFLSDGRLELRLWRGEFYRWNGTCYGKWPDDEVFSAVLPWLDHLRPETRPRHAREVMEAVGAVCIVEAAVEPPSWLLSEPK